MIKAIRGLSLLFAFSLIATAQSKVSSSIQVAVTGVHLENNKAKITILNSSQHNIIACAIRLTEQYSDGRVERGHIHIEYLAAEENPDIPFAKSLHPGETFEIDQIYDPGSIQAVAAKVAVAIYDNQTAEVTDERTFQDILETTRADASAYRASANAVKVALSDPDPRARAKAEMEKLLNGAEGEPSVYGSSYRSSLKQFADVVNRTSADNPVENLRKQADYFNHSADVTERFYGQIRRLP
jgi:hypothetical protein